MGRALDAVAKAAADGYVGRLAAESTRQMRSPEVRGLLGRQGYGNS